MFHFFNNISLHSLLEKNYFIKYSLNYIFELQYSELHYKFFDRLAENAGFCTVQLLSVNMQVLAI